MEFLTLGKWNVDSAININVTSFLKVRPDPLKLHFYPFVLMEYFHWVINCILIFPPAIVLESLENHFGS